MSNNNHAVLVSHTHSLCPLTKTFPTSASRFAFSLLILHSSVTQKLCPCLEVGTLSAAFSSCFLLSQEHASFIALIKRRQTCYQYSHWSFPLSGRCVSARGQQKCLKVFVIIMNTVFLTQKFIIFSRNY